jgi:hypothetical protein
MKKYDSSRVYLLTAFGFPPGSNGPNTCTQKARTVIYIKRNNTDHRTHAVDRKHIKQKNKSKNDNNNLND